MADLLISPIFEILFANLTSAVMAEIKLLWNVEKEVDNLRKTLSTISAVLEDAEEQQLTSRAVKDWLRKLKDVVYDVDDVLDDFATEAAQAKREQVPPESSTRSKQVIKFFTCCFCANKLVIKHKIGSKMDEIRERLDKIQKDRQFHLTTSTGEKAVEIIDNRKTSSSIGGVVVFGRDEDIQKIVQILMSDESNNANQFSVLPIIGMGGQGKTTLAQHVYNDKQLENLFEVRAWVCVSDSFDVLKITKDIIESVTKNNFGPMAIDPTQSRLSELLSGKRFLIILDDVWSENPFDWDSLRRPFFGGASGSKIIVTTRSEKVAQIMGTIPPHSLKHLSPDDSWSLFERIVFRGDILDIVQDTLIDIGKKIVGKCGGLPLAIKSLGGILSFTRKESDWKNVLESKIWDLKDTTLPALRLSYQHLPANLKQCFAYCALFLKDYEFDKNELVKFWMGEGYIQPRAGMEIEEVGAKLFDDLLARSFFSLSNNNEFRYIMHDLIHDLAEFVSKDDCLRIEVGEPIEAPKDARHLCLICPRENELIKLDESYGCKSLLRIRTLMLKKLGWGGNIVQLGDSFDKFNCLRVLSLTHSGIKEIPDSIGNFKHLRYLDLSFNPIERLPDSICSLYNLQTLILKWCDSLIELPKGTMDLINLRHLQFDYCGSLTYLPPRMGKLIQLRELSNFIVGEDGSECTIVELKHLVNLGGNLEISSLENVANREEAEEADLKSKKRLEKLTLCWNSTFNNSGQEEAVLEGLQPCSINLKELTIDDYMGASLPGWLLQQNQLLTFTNLVSITFSSCKKCQLLPPLGSLPSLKYLVLNDMERLERLERQFCGVHNFPLLEYLYLDGLVNLEEWWGEEGGGDYMPSLRNLCIDGCPKLKRFPLHLISPALVAEQLRFPSLKYLSLRNCHISLIKSVPYLTSLESLDIWGDDEVESLDLQNLHSLHKLRLFKCSKLSIFYPPPNLKELRIEKCDNLEALPLDLQNLHSLHVLRLFKCSKLSIFYPPPNLKELWIEKCDNIEALPLDLHNLSSLKKLELIDCPKLASLPDKGLPASLYYLAVQGCPLLIQRCEKEKGEDWHKISHIPNLYIVDDEEITDDEDITDED